MSSETVSEARSALQSAVAATDSLIENEGDSEFRARALAGRKAMLELCDQLSSLQDDTILAEVALNVPPAIQWLPHAVQNMLSTKVSLGQAIIAAAKQTGSTPSRFGDAHLVELASLNEVVRQRSSSPRVNLVAEAARPRRSPQSQPKPILEPLVPKSKGSAEQLHMNPGSNSEDGDNLAFDGIADRAATPAPAGYFIGSAKDNCSASQEAPDGDNIRVPSTGTLDSRASTSSAFLRKRAEVARKRAEHAALALAAEEAELLADEASSTWMVVWTCYTCHTYK